LIIIFTFCKQKTNFWTQTIVLGFGYGYGGGFGGGFGGFGGYGGYRPYGGIFF